LVWGGRVAKNEAVEDTWIDLADYGIIALLVRRGKWPKSDPPADTDFEGKGWVRQ